MQVRTSDNTGRSRFELHADGELAGFADYQIESGVMVLPHTEVKPRYRGRGLASRLIAYALDSARSQGLSVQPICPFVSDYISRNTEYLSLVPADQQARYGLRQGSG